MMGETAVYQPETFANQDISPPAEVTCDNMPVSVMAGVVAGFNLSTLATHAPGLVIRPWSSAMNPVVDRHQYEYPGDPNSPLFTHACFGFPQILAPTFRVNQ